MTTNKKIELYTKYPISSVLIYNGTTIAHYLLGGGIILGYGSWVGYSLGFLYLALSFMEMYLHMPLKVCPNCVYYKLPNSLCISGLNLVSRRVSREEGSVKAFSIRAKGPFCPNNLYIASLAFPILGIIPALILRFSLPVLLILLVIVVLLLFRFLVIFPKIACVHCRAQNICPQAQSMGFGKE